MAQTRALPQLDDVVFLTDSGLETDLVFSGGWDLPDFAAYPLLERDDGRAALRRYVDEHLEVARDAGLGIVVETPTWRASPDWGARLGHDLAALTAVNQRAAQLVDQARRDAGDVTVVVSGCLGPRGDGYVAGEQMTPAQAADYHRPQVEAFADSPVDLVSALTLTGVAEAVGVVEAARAAGLPVVVSFTVETDGRLPDGTPLGDAVRAVEDATGGAAAYFMVNCAHPDHLAPALDPGADWWPRLRGVRANASRMSHAELDDAPELDAGDPGELARQLADLRPLGVTVLGGCCGTDVRHIRALAGELVR
jgi:homocysteine S-methyltransferase